MSDPPTLKDQIECLQRELFIRTEVYPTWIAAGQMTRQVADREIETMKAAVGTLQRLTMVHKKRPSPKVKTGATTPT